MAGDSLARGARSATFGPAKVSQTKWDAIFPPDESAAPKAEGVGPIPVPKKAQVNGKLS